MVLATGPLPLLNWMDSFVCATQKFGQRTKHDARMGEVRPSSNFDGDSDTGITSTWSINLDGLVLCFVRDHVPFRRLAHPGEECDCELLESLHSALPHEWNFRMMPVDVHFWLTHEMTGW